MSDRPLQAERDTIRLPLYGEEDTTVQTTNLSPFGQGQEFINCIPQFESNPATKEGQVIIQKRPGLQGTGLSLTSYFTGLSTAKDFITVTQLQDVQIAAVFDAGTNKIYILMLEAASLLSFKLGEISGCTAYDYCFLTEMNVAGRPTLGVVWTKYDRSTSKAFWTDCAIGAVFAPSSLAQITDAEFPTQLGTPKVLTGAFVQMDQAVYIMTTDGYIYNNDTDLNTITDWHSLGNIQSYAYPDKGIGLVRYKHHIVAFSEDSIEFFNNVGNPPPGSPLQRTDQAFIKFGCVDPRCMINVDDTLYWIAASSRSTDGLWKLEGYTPVKVSNPKRDLQIAKAYNVSNNSYNIYLKSLSMQGTTNILITGVSGQANTPYSSLTANGSDTNPPANTECTYQMLCYCVDYGTWWGINDAESNAINVWHPAAYYPIQGGAIQNKYLQHVLKAKGGTGVTCGFYYFETTNTNSYFIDETFANTAPAANKVTAVMQLPSIEFQTLKRKFMHKLSISMEPIDSAEATSYMYIVYSKDENTGGTPITRSLVMNNAVKRYYLNRLGLSRRVQFALVNKSSNAWKVRALELEVSQGLH